MSLINDALKKAQKMHHEEAAAAASNLSPGAPGPRHRGKGTYSTGTVALISAGVAVLVCGTVLATILVLRRTPQPLPEPALPSGQAQTGSPAPQTLSAQATTPSLPAPPAPSTPANQSSPRGETENPGPMLSLANLATPPSAVTEAAPSPTPVAPTQPKASSSDAPSSQVPNFVFTSPEPEDHTRPNPAIQRYVDRLRVSGVRKTNSVSKVIINDKVYRINDLVDRALGVRLTEAEGDRLVFTDEYGHRYVRNF